MGKREHPGTCATKQGVLSQQEGSRSRGLADKCPVLAVEREPCGAPYLCRMKSGLKAVDLSLSFCSLPLEEKHGGHREGGTALCS